VSDRPSVTSRLARFGRWLDAAPSGVRWAAQWGSLGGATFFGLRRTLGDREISAEGPLVLLGAGEDDRARFAPDRVFFEVDRPATSQRKAAAPLPNVRYVACDLLRPGLGDALRAAGFDAAAPACFVAEGLFMYLDDAAISLLFAEVAGVAAPGSRIVVTCLEADAPWLAAIAGAVGEPFRNRLAPDEVEAKMAAGGFAVRSRGDLKQRADGAGIGYVAGYWLRFEHILVGELP
jgi:O-methyltransferase involved in polyketide biosynthesis